jgi:fructokinase
MLLTKDEINPDWLDNCIFHVGSVGLIESPMLYAHIKAIDLVKKKGSILSFDPNIRLNLWKKPEDCLTAVKSIFTLADIVKVSYDEISFITGESDEEEGTMALFQGLNKLVIVTRGNKGASVYTHHFEVSHPGFTVDVVDTTGAGDAFMGAFLHQISKIFKPLENLTPEELFEMLKFSNAVAAISVTKQGAIASLPTLKEVEEFLEKHK